MTHKQFLGKMLQAARENQRDAAADFFTTQPGTAESAMAERHCDYCEGYVHGLNAALMMLMTHVEDGE